MLKKILSGGFANIVMIFASMVGNIIRSAFAMRYLPPIEAGVWFLFLNVIMVLSFCDFGLSPTLSREIGFAFKKKNKDLRISNLFFTIRRLISIIFLLVVILLLAFGYLYFYHLPLTALQKHEVILAFMIFGTGISFQFFMNPYLAVIYGLGHVDIERYLRAAGPVIGVIVSWLLLINGWGLFALVTGYVAQTFLIYFLSRLALKKFIVLSPNGRYLPIIVKRIARPALQWTLIIVGAVLVFQTSNFIIAYIMGPKAVPQFAILLQVAALIITTANIIGVVITPLVSQAAGRRNWELVQRFFSFSTRMSTGIAIVLAIFFYFFIDVITHIWLGNGFVVNKQAFVLLLAAVILEINHVSCASVTMAAGYVKFATISIISGILTLTSSFIFVKTMGVTGAALAIFISQILTSNWYIVIYSLKYLCISFGNYIKKTSFPLLKFFIYMLVMNILLRKILGYNFTITENMYLRLFMGLIFNILILTMGGWVFLVSREERKIVRQKIRKFYSRA